MRFLTATAQALFEEQDVPRIQREKCANDRYTKITCHSCEAACPANAIKESNIDTNKCVGCGLCTMVCKSDAIEGVSLPLRDFHQGWLCATPDTFITKTELLYWVEHKNIHGILSSECLSSPKETNTPSSIFGLKKTVENSSMFQQVIDETNQSLPAHQSQLRIKFAEDVSLKRRRLLKRLGVVASSNSSESYSSSSEAFPYESKRHHQEYQVSINLEQCNSCLACTRECQSGALSVRAEKENKTLIIDSSKCNRCLHCQAVCLPQAITINNKIEVSTDVNERNKPEIESINLYPHTCHSCSNHFYAHQSIKPHCFICENRGQDHMKE